MSTAVLEAKTRRIRRRRRRVPAPRRQAVAGAHLQAARGGPVPGHGRMPRRRLVHERPDDREAAPPVHGVARRRVDRARFPLRQRGSRIRPRCRTSTTRCAGPRRTPRELKTRPDLIGLSGQSSGGHLAMLVAMRPARSALRCDRAAGRHAGAGRERALRDHVLAGDQPAQPLPPRQARHQAPIRRHGRSRSSRGTTPTGARRPTWRKATRCWRSSAARRC